MIHLYNLADANLLKPSVVTIGVFDGVHQGHRVLIERLVNEAKSADLMSVVLTFFPHPDRVLRGLTGRYYLTSPEQRAEELGKLGVDCVVTHPFNDETRHLRAADFVNQLVESLKMRELWVGTDFALGYKREGNVEFLTARGLEQGFNVTAIDLVLAENTPGAISSTTIRQALENGEVEQAATWLGRPYVVRGEVVHGLARGRTIGFPTANIDVWAEQVIPANGVYAGMATLATGERYKAVTNIGVRPTFDGTGVTVEAHLLDFDGDLYGQQLIFSFEHRLRGEQKFNGVQELIAQITADAQAGRVILTP
ncbi:MAG: bifunctional riboflavin kinase/FAD synthetase [Anaerolineae bacterium]|nr:bifunctional riboflavin kinase/FAD synthetase [Anaerolineae bacterium]